MGSLKGPSKGRFQQIFSDGFRANRPLLRLYVLPGNGAIGIATSQSIGSKPQRNRVKRRIREAIRPFLPRLMSWDMVVLAKGPTSLAEFREICNQLGELIDEMEQRWEKQSEFS
ncbi:MAG: ribonuclease P protein component [Fimbriimonadaceae bacterium]|nr:ribonuclease P protein component [Fimbriimonadaceae bacterium]